MSINLIAVLRGVVIGLVLLALADWVVGNVSLVG